jgi:nucleotide-binding universal stress UspA family protein
MNGRPVVVGIDGSPAALAVVRWAVDDAVRRDRGLRIVHVAEPWVFDLPLATPPGFHESLTERSQAVLSEAAKVARDRAPGLRVETVAHTGGVRKELLRESHDAEVLVVGSRGLGGFMGLMLGSVSMGVTGHADCPVVVAGHVQETAYGEIVVGHDVSPDSEPALEFAFEEAARRGARLRAVYAWQVSVYLPMFTSYTSDLEQIYDFGTRAAKEHLLPWRDKYPQVEVHETVVRAHPVEALAEASSRADLLVVGSRGRGAFGSAVLGSVGHGVLHHAYCPVAIVRSHPSPAPAGDRDPSGGGGLGR